VKRHYHQLEKPCLRVRVLWGGHILAETCDVISLKEVGKKVYDPVFYVSKEDIRMDLLTPSSTRTKCPIKGEASYWNLTAKDKTVKDIAWSYEQPIEYSKPIQGRLAFDTNRVIIELIPF